MATISQQVKIDGNGKWNYRVPNNLEPGTYTIRLNGEDTSGSPISKEYTFTVSQAGVRTTSVVTPTRSSTGAATGSTGGSTSLPSSGLGSDIVVFLILALLMLCVIFIKIFIRYYDSNKLERDLLRN